MFKGLAREGSLKGRLNNPKDAKDRAKSPLRGCNTCADARTEITSDDDKQIIVRVVIPSRKKRRKQKQSEQQLARAKKEISDLKLVTAEGSRQLDQAFQRIEELKKAKDVRIWPPNVGARIGGL